ncbi:peptidase dimerization domain protein [Candidatus Moduliflexus flocculans]|uniref:Peptidase dimerization domain protein n=1 Tax=Candidatus Moduliflexus flocculans TaxID=1499966 RepID=A0A0S6W583_9BACT|nr:peptidase dimerization domain protein [Candidatus Moduliflexus flocculans]
MPFATFDELIAFLPQLESPLHEMQDIILANLVAIGEIPAPTFEERKRVEFLQERFTDIEMLDCSTDEMENVYAILPGETGEKHLLVTAHLDTIFPDDDDHTITMSADEVTGTAVADNSLGIAVMASLPYLLRRLNLRLQSNVILMGAARTLGRGNLAGLRFFLENSRMPIQAGIAVEGIELGRLSYSSVGMLRGEITCLVPDDYDWTRFDTTGAITNLNEVINQILALPLPRQPRTSVVLGSIEGGEQAYGKIAKFAQLRFEIRSESADVVESIREEIQEIVMEQAAKTNKTITAEFFGKRTPGGLAISHPLCRQTRRIMEALSIEPHISPSLSGLSAFIDRKIPAITLGITKGQRTKDPEETILIAPIAKGVAQLIGVLLAIDGGFCDETR